MTAYITLDQVIAAMSESAAPADDDTWIRSRITELCDQTAELIDAELSHDFHQHPPAGYEVETGTETRIRDGRGQTELHVHFGIVSLESIETRCGRGEWREVDVEDYELVSMFEAEGERPYDHIRRTRGRWPSGRGNVRLTGVFGWEAPPLRLVEANIAWVRQQLAAGDSYSGALQASDQFIPTPRLVIPDMVRMFLTRESRRYQDCWT